MKSILIASRNPADVRELKETISQEYNVSVVTSLKELGSHLEQSDAILLDHEFTEHSGKEVITGILKKSYLPIITLSNPDNVKGAIEAMMAGACSYIVKVGDYHHVLDLAIKEAIEKFDKQKQMNQTIITLKKQVKELEEQLKKAGKEDGKTFDPETKASILDEIVFIF